MLTVKDTVWSAGFEARLAELEAGGAISRAEETAPYVSMPGADDTTPSRGVVLRIA